MLQESWRVESRDRRLLLGFTAVGLFIMSLGGVFALLMKLVRTPVLSILPAPVYYQSLTGHGIFMFIFWLGFIQTAFLIASATILIGRPLWSYALAWLGLATMTAASGFAFVAVWRGANLTYHAPIQLAEKSPHAWMIYLAYVLLAVGMALVVFDVVMTFLGGVGDLRSFSAWARFLRDLPVASFAAFAGLFIAVPGLMAAIRTFGAALLWSLGRGPIDAEMYRMDWHIVFHIYHYVPALTLVGITYVLVELTVGAHSVYAKQLAKALFLMYPIFVPPTFIYHLLVDPNLPQNVKFVGTTLSLLVGVPTLLHSFIIVGMLEARARRAGFGRWRWVGQLPWSNPVFGSMAVGWLTLFVGGLVAYLLLQEPLASMLHSTFVVPAYIHPIAAGGANITYMGALYYGLPFLLGRRLWAPKLARIQPYLMGFGLTWMAFFGIAAGLAGVPRRYALIGPRAPQEWEMWLNLSLGIGAMLAIVAGIAFVSIIVMTALVGEKATSSSDAVADLGPPAWSDTGGAGAGPISLAPALAFIVALLLLTVWALDRLASLPIQKH